MLSLTFCRCGILFFVFGNNYFRVVCICRNLQKQNFVIHNILNLLYGLLNLIMNSKICALHRKLGFISSLAFKTCRLSSTAPRNFVNIIEDEKKKTANIVMQRPPVNSLNAELLQQLTSAIKLLEEKKFRGFIISSSSPTVFSAGLDITEMYKPEEKRLRLFWTSLQTMWKTLYTTPLISIAAINGHCPAAGCLIALSCDHSIMVKSRATIGLNETMLGIVAPKWFRQIFINTINFRQAEHALNQGKLFSPEDALKLRIVNDLVDSPSDLAEKCQKELEKWLLIPDTARRLTKISMRKQYVDELISYEKQELEDIVKFVYQEETQAILGAYFKSLKEPKK